MTSVRSVLVALATCLILSLIVDAQGIVHSGQGMPDGPERTITLHIGRVAQRIGNATHVTWIWSTLAAVHGYKPQPDVPPMLAIGSNTTPTAQATPRPAGPGTPERPTGRGPKPPPRHRKPIGGIPTIRIPTRRNPLRLLVTGDSLTEFVGPDVVNGLSGTGRVRATVDTHYGTGLVRPDFVDWSLIARQQTAASHPEAIVVMIGGNDFQNMELAGGKIIYTNTPAWTREYQRRAAIVMRAWIQRGVRRVYWLSFPPARSEAWARNNAQINIALRRAARHVPGAKYVDILGPVTDHGAYADWVTIDGEQTLVREPDGIHFNATGSRIVASEVMDFVKREWHLMRH